MPRSFAGAATRPFPLGKVFERLDLNQRQGLKNSVRLATNRAWFILAKGGQSLYVTSQVRWHPGLFRQLCAPVIPSMHGRSSLTLDCRLPPNVSIGWSTS